MAKTVDHSARPHSELPPSSANKWMRCFGWRATVAQHLELYGEPPTSAAAKEGTIAHEKFERHLMGSSNMGPVEAELLDYVVETHKRPLSPKDDEFDDLIECVEWVQDQPGVMFPEMRVDFGSHLGYVGLTGTADVTLVEPRRLTIADLKFGRQVVEVRDKTGRINPQLGCYLVGAINRFGEREEYQIVILQPRAYHPQGPIRKTTVTRAELLVFMFDLEEAIALNYKNSACVPGDWCRNFCPAQPTCRALVMHGRKRFAEADLED